MYLACVPKLVDALRVCSQTFFPVCVIVLCVCSDFLTSEAGHSLGFALTSALLARLQVCRVCVYLLMHARRRVYPRCRIHVCVWVYVVFESAFVR